MSKILSKPSQNIPGKYGYTKAYLSDEERQEKNAARKARRVERKNKDKQKKGKVSTDAESGKFPFTEIHGMTLKEVDWTIPPQKERKRKRSAFNGIREEFLRHIGETMEPQLRDLGLTEKQIDQVKKGSCPNGYNVHHKLPIHGGGKNEFSNLILMPIPPHNDLHHDVMDPQVKNLQEGVTKKVLIPWTDDMVYVLPEKKKAREQQASKQEQQNNMAMTVHRKLVGRRR